MKYPVSLQILIDFYKSLPGIGEKTALRLALSTTKLDEIKLEKMSNVLSNLKSKIKTCNICGNICDNDICFICDDLERKKNVICVVEDYINLLKFEESGVFDGVYHVLNGLISPMNDVNPDDLNIDKLIERVKNESDCEVILVLRSSIEGEMTMLYLKKVLAKYNVKVTRLSHGLPLGMNLEFMDGMTINKAFEDRREVID